MNTSSGQLRRNRRHLTSSVDQTPDVCVPRSAQPVEMPEDESAGVTNEAEACVPEIPESTRAVVTKETENRPPVQPRSPINTRLRTGTVIRPPDRLDL